MLPKVLSIVESQNEAQDKVSSNWELIQIQDLLHVKWIINVEAYVTKIRNNHPFQAKDFRRWVVVEYIPLSYRNGALNRLVLVVKGKTLFGGNSRKKCIYVTDLNDSRIRDEKITLFLVAFQAVVGCSTFCLDSAYTLAASLQGSLNVI